MTERSYENDAVRVSWRSELCVHVARCLRGLPSVFDLERRPWIDIDGARVDQIAETVEACPSGALTYERLDGKVEQPQRPAHVIAALNGPLVVRGDVRICDAEGSELARETRVTLCRCGQSLNQPFCDNSHRRIGFRAGSEAFGERQPVDEGARKPLRVIPLPDASLHLEGPLIAHDHHGGEIGRGGDLFLCRCGQSSRKPLCDRSHEQACFSSSEPTVSAVRAAAQSPAPIEHNEQI